VYEVAVIGTGFGGAVVACRTAQRWPGQVVVLERGKRYARGSFARSPADMRDNFWDADGRHPDRRGLFDVRSYRRMDVVVAAGFGGGSLVYANVILKPPAEVFANPAWPASCPEAVMDPYFDVVRTVLDARPVPAEPRIPRTELFRHAAVAIGRSSRPLDLAVTFGRDPGASTDLVNAFGAEQGSCTYCGECDIGCNVGAKNTLDLNYLHAAEHHHGAEIRTDSLVESIVPVDADGRDDPTQDGTHGYRVTYRHLAGDPSVSSSVAARRVVVAAGALGSTELLLRCRDVHRTLPRLSPALGSRFSGNGDFLSFLASADSPTRPEYGPVITQAIDVNLFDAHDPQRAFVLEDAGYPNELAWYIEGAKPTVFKVRALARALVRRRRARGPIGDRLRDLLGGTVTSRSAVLLCMGIDTATGRLSLDRDGRITLRWPQRANRALYRAIIAEADRFGRAVGASLVVSAPSWWRPVRRNVTVHALGGCPLGEVVSDDPARFGEAAGHRHLYVADGAIIPIAVGANPSLTIAALAERVAEGITGMQPDATLGVTGT
jgi:cholesterol oxidase